MGRNVAATIHAYFTSFAGGYQNGRYHTTSNSNESKRSHGIGVVTRFVNMNTNAAPNSSPRFEPPTMI